MTTILFTFGHLAFVVLTAALAAGAAYADARGGALVAWPLTFATVTLAIATVLFGALT